MSEEHTRSMGWLPDYPDFRDYDPGVDKVPQRLKELGQHASIKEMLASVGHTAEAPATLPASADLRKWCSPIENQESIGSCTAHAGVGLLEYFERRAFGRHIDASRLFLYKTTRTLLHWTGDTGAFLRTTMGAMRIFGVPPEEHWPYQIADYDKEPPAYCYAYAQNFQAMWYYRLDPAGTNPSDLLATVKSLVARGLPAMFGFTVFDSISQARPDGKIPFPSRGEKVLGGHAVGAMGYDDNMKIDNTSAGGPSTTGAILIRNSWDTAWGDQGYGWLPYEYILQGLAIDWWSLLRNEWIDTKQFGL